MNKITEISSTLLAYLKRPDLYPELRRKIWKNLFNRSSALRGKTEAEQWCRQLAITEREFVVNVLKMDFVPFEKLFPVELGTALHAQQNAKVKMGGAGSLNVIYYINEFAGSHTSVETGVAYGWSSFAALASLERRNGMLYSSDMPYILQNHSEDFVGCVIPNQYRIHWSLYRFADKESLPKIFEKVHSIDVVHYDSDKTYDGRMWAYKLLWEKLRRGGVFMSDDIGDNAAFKDFCNHNNLSPHVIEFDGKYAGVVIKN